MYSILDVNNCENSVYKEHTFNMGHNEFINVHLHEKVVRHNMKVIKSNEHKIYTSCIDKTSLSAFDDKRYILSDGIHSLPYGHKDIPTRNW